MTNGDKYLKDGVDVKQLSREMFNFLVDDDIPLKIHIELFFAQPIKPTLTEDEKVILRNIPKDYVKIRRAKWIIDEKRMNYGQLEIVDDEGKYWTLCILSHLFQFIQPRRRI